MRIVLLALNGETARASAALAAHYPEATIAHITRVDFESTSVAVRLRNVRSMQPDIFAVSTERLAWQRGQDAFLLFGAMVGAKRSVLLDAHGGWREGARARILAVAPPRLAWETAFSAATVAQARVELTTLERSVAKRQTWKKANSHRGISGPGAEVKIVFLRATPGAGTQVGGAASHINGFVNAAQQQGACVRFIGNDEIAGLDPAKTPVTIIPPEPLGSTRAAFDLHNNRLFTRGAVREVAADLPDFIYQRYGRFGWAGVVASLRTGRPLFLEYNGSEVWVGRYWDRVGMLGLLERFERVNLDAAERIFVVSEVERNNLLRSGVDIAKIIVNPNGVDTSRFRPGIGGENERTSLGIASGETLVGFVGTFGPWHGVMTLAEAIVMIPAEKRIRFVLVGGGSLRTEVERVLREANAIDRVIFTGAVAHDKVPALLDACDVLASPHVPLADGSDFFGSPTKLFEYMAMGKGIVASRLGQIGDVLEDEKTALLVEPGNSKALSEAIVRLAESRELREKLGAAARESAVARHTWDHNAARVLGAYQEWLN